MRLIPLRTSFQIQIKGLFLLILVTFCNASARRSRENAEIYSDRLSPYFRSSQSVQKAKVHETVRFECNVANLGKNIITWHNVSSGRIIFAGPVNMFQDERLRIEEGGRVLHINEITEYDSGAYKCQVEVKLNPIFLEHHLNVLVPPRVFPSPPDGNYVVRSGNDIELICHAEGSPQPIITWRRKVGNKRMLPSGEAELQTPILRIPGVQRFDAGIFECTAENGVGEPATAELNLQVIYAPIVKLKDRKVYADPGQDEVILECFVYGEPFPEVHWKHQTNGQRPSNSPQSRLFTKMEGNRSILKIKNIDERDYGTYECAAHNNEGTATGEVELTGEPHQPEILSPEDSPSKHSYSLRWSIKSPYRILQQKVNYWELKPTTNHNVQNPHKTREEQRNELHLHSHEQHRLTQARIIENGLYPETNKYIYEVNIPDLKPDRTYVVQVKATNKFHEGEWSEKFLFRTSGRVVGHSVRGKSGLTSPGSKLTPKLWTLFIILIAYLPRW